MWVCPACGGPFSIKDDPFLVGMKVSLGLDGVLFLKATCPDHNDGAIIDLFKLYTNLGGKGIFADATSFTTDEIVAIIKNMIHESELATWVMLKSIPRKEVRLVNPMRMLEHFEGGKLCEPSRNMN
eukprot:7678284-Karenia_brevis.AAC.1